MLPNRLAQLDFADTPSYRNGWPPLALALGKIGQSVRAVVKGGPPPPVWYDWYVDGQYVGRTAAGIRTFLVGSDPVQIEVLAVRTQSAAVASRAAALPRRLLWWISSPDPASWYRVEEQQNGGSWNAVGMVRAVTGQWSYTWLSARLVDLAAYAWRVVPLDANGIAGTPIALPAETIVRVPDAPAFTVSVDPITQKATFSAA